METIHSKEHGIPISLPSGLSEEQLWKFKPFNNWLAALTKSLKLQGADAQHPFHNDPYQLRSVTVQAFDLFGGSRVGFLKIKSDVSNGAGEALPGSIFLRGPSVAMMVVLVPDDVGPDDDEKYVVLTVQPRVPASSLAFVELPAGMVDDEGSFAGVAAKEIKEELGLEIHESELTCLSDLAAESVEPPVGGYSEELPLAMYPSAGGCDEFITIYLHQRRIPRSQLADWAGRLTGLREHGERITLKLVPMKDLWREGARDAKCLSALALWEGLRREGKL